MKRINTTMSIKFAEAWSRSGSNKGKKYNKKSTVLFNYYKRKTNHKVNVKIARYLKVIMILWISIYC